MCKWGGGGAAPHPTPMLSFCAVQACFQEHRTMNKDWFKHIEVIDLFKSHHACSLFANGGATSPEAIWTLSVPVTCVCKSRSPPLSFYAAQACFQKHRTINTTCFTSIIVLDLLNPSCWQSICKRGGYVRPNPRTSLSCTRPLQVSSCQQKQNPYGPFQNP